jgi:hypothetical protein
MTSHVIVTCSDCRARALRVVPESAAPDVDVYVKVPPPSRLCDLPGAGVAEEPGGLRELTERKLIASGGSLGHRRCHASDPPISSHRLVW